MSPLNKQQLLQEQLTLLLQRLIDEQRTLSYRQVIELLALPAPAMQSLTAALEDLAAQDLAAGRALRSALIVSQRAPYRPNNGFFQHLSQLTQRTDWETQTQQADWHQYTLNQLFAD